MAVDFTTIADGSTRLGVKTSGALLKVHANNPNRTKVIYTITNQSTISPGAVTANLSSNINNTYIEKGTLLYFGALTPITAAESKLIGTSSTSIAIQPFGGELGIGGGSTATTYAMVTLATTDISNNEEIGLAEIKAVSHGGQLSQEKISRSLSVTASLIIRPEDYGYFYNVLPTALDTYSSLNTFLAIPAGNNQYEYTIGDALVSIDEDPNPVNEIRRPTITLTFQSPWLKTSLYRASSNDVKTLIHDAVLLAGVRTTYFEF